MASSQGLTEKGARKDPPDSLLPMISVAIIGLNKSFGDNGEADVYFGEIDP